MGEKEVLMDLPVMAKKGTVVPFYIKSSLSSKGTTYIVQS